MTSIQPPVARSPAGAIGVIGRHTGPGFLRLSAAFHSRPELTLVWAAENGRFLRLSAARETHRPKDGLSLRRQAVWTAKTVQITTGGLV